jgi:hypothetical protein
LVEHCAVCRGATASKGRFIAGISHRCGRGRFGCIAAVEVVGQPPEPSGTVAPGSPAIGRAGPREPNNPLLKRMMVLDPTDGDMPIGCINIATVTMRMEPMRLRPRPAQFASELAETLSGSGV